MRGGFGGIDSYGQPSVHQIETEDLLLDELPARDEQRWGLRCHEESTKSKVPNTKALLKFPAEQNQR